MSETHPALPVLRLDPIPAPMGWRHSVVSRFLLTSVVAASALVIPARGASADAADWTPWTPYTYPSMIDAACGATTVHVTFPMNKEQQRTETLPDGTTVQQITGTLRTHFATDAGAAVTLNQSGPGLVMTYPNGDVETRSMGQYGNGLSPEQAAELGVPQMFASTGLIDFITHPLDGSITPIRVPDHVDSVCAMLGL